LWAFFAQIQGQIYACVRSHVRPRGEADLGLPQLAAQLNKKAPTENTKARIVEQVGLQLKLVMFC
jgi:hypothetical protein